MASVIIINYSKNSFIQTKDIIELQAAKKKTSKMIGYSKNIKLKFIVTSTMSPPSLTEDEFKLIFYAGNAAIAARKSVDFRMKPSKNLLPNIRHQRAMETSKIADLLALQGTAEIAATHEIEKIRYYTKKPSSFGTLLNVSWVKKNVCIDYDETFCSKIQISKYRRIDGACNHPQNLGMAFTSFRRILPPDYGDGINTPRTGKFGHPLPSAREISLKVHSPLPSSNPAFTVMLAVFGQFLDHDITATAISRGINGDPISCCLFQTQNHQECFPVKVEPLRSVNSTGKISCIEFVRSAPAAQCKLGPRQQLNQVTAFIDGSVIYGANNTTAKNLREFNGGRLRMQKTSDNRFILPPSLNPNDGCNSEFELSKGRYCFASGDPRANENLHLTTMHLLWARQHNKLTENLSKINPHWKDETLYQEARRIVAAQLQHITYNEFLPIIIGDQKMKNHNIKLLNHGFKDFDPAQIDPSIANSFSTASFRFAHTLLPGLMKLTDGEKGTSGWVQLHKILFNPYSLYNKGGVESSITSAISNNIQMTSTHVTSQLTSRLFEDTRSNISVPCGLDLVSLNIQRGRDHGIPGYVRWRDYCGLKKTVSFNDLKNDMDPKAFIEISKLYAHVDDIDLYTGALAEIPVNDGLLGPTFLCLNTKQFEKLQLGDRYWYELFNQPGSFNKEQLKELRKTTLANIICETSDNIQKVQIRVMRSVSLDNPLTSCKDISRPSFSSWKE